MNAMSNADKPVPFRENLDREHELIDVRLEGLLLKIHSGAERQALCDAVRDLINDISMHFGYEESLMATSIYPGFDHHRRQHVALMTELGLLLDRFEDATRFDNKLLRSADFLTEWYRRHEVASDRPLLAWLDEAALNRP